MGRAHPRYRRDSEREFARLLIPAELVSMLLVRPE